MTDCSKKYYHKHRDRILAQKRERYALDNRKTYFDRYRKENKEYIILRNKIHHLKMKERKRLELLAWKSLPRYERVRIIEKKVRR